MTLSKTGLIEDKATINIFSPDLDKYFADDVSIFYELHFYIKQDQKCTMSMENDFIILLFVFCSFQYVFVR